MSSFRWGMIACPTPRNSQVTARKAGAIPFSHQIWIVFLTVLHSEVWLTSAIIPFHFGLSLCNPLEQISPLCAIWKGTYMAFNWGIKAWSAPRGCIAIKLVNDLSSFASYFSSSTDLSYGEASDDIAFLFAKIHISYGMVDTQQT